MMKRLLFIFGLCLASAHGASPSFNNFDTNYFRTNGYRIGINTQGFQAVINGVTNGLGRTNWAVANVTNAGSAAYSSSNDFIARVAGNGINNDLTNAQLHGTITRALDRLLVPYATASRVAVLGAAGELTNTATVTPAQLEALEAYATTNHFVNVTNGRSISQAITNTAAQTWSISGDWGSGVMYEIPNTTIGRWEIGVAFSDASDLTNYPALWVKQDGNVGLPLISDGGFVKTGTTVNSPLVSTFNGSSLTNLNASELRSGTVPYARLPDVTNSLTRTNDTRFLSLSGGILESNFIRIDATHALSISNATASRVAAIGADATVTNVGSLTGLTYSGGVLSTGRLTNHTDVAGTALTAGDILGYNGSIWTNGPPVAGVGGGVTSVALAGPSQYAISGSPVTTSGTLTFGWNNQSANTCLLGPSSGAAAAPTFRVIAPLDLQPAVALTNGHTAAVSLGFADWSFGANIYNTNLGGKHLFYAIGGGRKGFVRASTTDSGIILGGTNGAGADITILDASMGVGSPTVGVNGALTVSGSKSFLIPHPLDPNGRLRHASVESPQADLIYRGTLTLTNGQGRASIDQAARMRSGTFAALTRRPQAWAQNVTGWDALQIRVDGGDVVVFCSNSDSQDTVSWFVVAERKDPDYLKSCDADGNFNVEK